MSESRRTEHTLLSTADAEVWATEFCRIFSGYEIRAGNYTVEGCINEGVMIGWFANAMQTAVNLSQAEEVGVDLLRVDESPADEDDDDDPRTELEQSFVEGFHEGRPPTA